MLSVRVNGGVECRIVVHLELAVEFEAASSGEGFGPEASEACGEVVALTFKDGEPRLVAFGVSRGCVGAVDLLGGVEDFEGEDGEPVDDEAGGLGVELGGRKREVVGCEEVEQRTVELFGEVVAALVGFVDAALDAGELGVGGIGAAGFVFGVPELEVGEVLAGDESGEGLPGQVPAFHGFLVPSGGELIVERGDGVGGEHVGLGEFPGEYECIAFRGRGLKLRSIGCGVGGGWEKGEWSWTGILPKKHGGVLLLSTSGGRLAAVGGRWVMAEERFLCISTYEKGQAYMEQLAELGVRPTLLTTDKHRHGDWPREILEEVATMPEALTEQQVLNTVTWMARGRKFDRLTALDEFDMEVVARLREHMRIPGMGTSVVANYRDKLAMRTTARDAGFLVPEFVGVLNYDDLRDYMDQTPGPWLLKPRAEASALGIKKIGEPEQLWRALDELGDRQSYFLLERFVAGDIYHVDSIVSEGRVVFAAVHKYGRPPMQVMHDGGVFTTRTVDRASEDWRELTELNGRLAPALGLRRGVTHGEYIKSREDGKFYFLEIAARVGGAFIADLVEHSTGVNLWREWARIDVADLRGVPYTLPVVREEYAGSVLCLAKEADTDTSAFQAPEIVYRMTKHHHAGLIVRSKEPGRVEELLEEYSQAFLEQFMASMPVPDRPTA